MKSQISRTLCYFSDHELNEPLTYQFNLFLVQKGFKRSNAAVQRESGGTVLAFAMSLGWGFPCCVVVLQGCPRNMDLSKVCLGFGLASWESNQVDEWS